MSSLGSPTNLLPIQIGFVGRIQHPQPQTPLPEEEDMDNLLDEIDSVLEENAEEFVKNYVQRGGE